MPYTFANKLVTVYLNKHLYYMHKLNRHEFWYDCSICKFYICSMYSQKVGERNIQANWNKSSVVNSGMLCRIRYQINLFIAKMLLLMASQI